MADTSVKTGLLRHIVQVKEEYPLNQWNPLKAGGVADFYAEVESTVELAAAVKSAIDMQVPYLVIGHGDKVLFSDSGFPGLVIHNRTSSFAMATEQSQV